MKHPWQGLGNLPRGVLILSLTTLINRLGTMALPFLVLYLTKSRGFTAGRAGLVMMVYGLTAIVAGPTAGRLSDRIGAVRVLQASLLFSGLVVLVYPLARSPGAIFALTIAWAFTNESFRPANLSMFSELAGPAQRRTAFARERRLRGGHRSRRPARSLHGSLHDVVQRRVRPRPLARHHDARPARPCRDLGRRIPARLPVRADNGADPWRSRSASRIRKAVVP